MSESLPELESVDGQPVPEPAGEYGKILHELREAETGTCGFLDLPVLRSQWQYEKILHQLRQA